MSKSIKFKINEDMWTARLLTQEQYHKVYNDDTAATTDFDSRKIDFNETFDLKVIIHEISHCYNDYLHLKDTNTNQWDDMTEIISTSNERNLFLILEKSLLIYNRFRNDDKKKHIIESFLKTIRNIMNWSA